MRERGWRNERFKRIIILVVVVWERGQGKGSFVGGRKSSLVVFETESNPKLGREISVDQSITSPCDE